MNAEISVLSDFDSAQLDQLEERIGTGLSSFIEVGEALSAIRERRLYRATHGTFEDYCKQKWGMSASRARQLVGAAEVASSVTIVTLSTESQARELARVEPAQRQAVVEKAIQATGGKITAASLKEAAKPAPTIEFEPVVEMPPQRRRARAAFILGDWQDHARTVLRMTLESVPAVDKRAAINFLSKLIGELAEPQLAPTMPVKLGAIGAATNGLMYARLAIAQLEKIERNDGQKAAAFELVRNYVEGGPNP